MTSTGDGEGSDGPAAAGVTPPTPVDRLLSEKASAGGYRSLFANRNYRRFFGAGLISSLGDWTGFVALQALVSTLYENPRFALFGLGGVMMARLLPSLIAGPAAGILADRYDRKRLMVTVDILRGLLFVGIAFSRNLTTLFLLTFAVESAALLYLSAKDATLPTIVNKRHLTQANQLNLLLAYGTLPLGALVVSLLTYALTRAGGMEPQDATVVALLVNAASFFVAAAFTAGLRLPGRTATRRDHEEHPGVVAELTEGLRFIRDFPLIRSLILGVVGAFFGAGVVVTLGPEYVATVLDRPAVEWSRLLTFVGLGLVGGISLTHWLEQHIQRERLFPLALSATGAIAAVIAWLPNFALAQGFGLVLGATAGLSFVTGYSLLQAHTTDETRGRTFGAFYTSTRIALFSALGISPFIAAAISGVLVTGGEVYVLDGIRITMFLGALVALWAALRALRGINRALRDLPDRPVRMGATTAPTLHPGGVFIAFEGVEGSGKSTQVEALCQRLRSEGRDIVMTREPGGPPVAERVRDLLLDPSSTGMDPRTEALLYAAARAEHVQQVVVPALEEGRIVVCDRFIDSSLAYQGFARELGDADVFEINRWAVGGLLPDVVVLLDLSADEGLRRVRARARAKTKRELASGPQPVRLGDWREQTSPDRLEAENLEFHRRVAKGYRELARRDRRRFIVVDANADADTISRQVRAALHPWLPLPHSRGASNDEQAGGTPRQAGEQ